MNIHTIGWKPLGARQFLLVETHMYRSLKEKWIHFDLKSWVTGGTKIRPGILSNLTIFESNWLDIESQIVQLTRYWESYCQFDSQIESIWPSNRVNLTPNIESIWHLISSQFDSNIITLLRIPGRILVPPVTQLFRSKWLHFFYQCCSNKSWWSNFLNHFKRYIAGARCFFGPSFGKLFRKSFRGVVNRAHINKMKRPLLKKKKDSADL